MKGLLVCVVVSSVGCKDGVKEAVKAVPLTGTVELSPQAGSSTAAGKLALREVGTSDVEVTGTLTGLTAGSKYVVHYHAPQGCPPPTDKHDDTNHKSDLATVTAEGNGTAPVKATIPNARLGGMEPITSYCITVHAADGGPYLASGRILTPSLGLGGGN